MKSSQKGLSNLETTKISLLTLKEKQTKTIFQSLPKKSKIKELLETKQITMKDIEEIIPAILIGAGFDRKNVANLFSLTIGLQSHIREVKKMAREQLKRYKTRINFSSNQRRYFEYRILFGWSSTREVKAIASEIIEILNYLHSKSEHRIAFMSAGVDLSKIAGKIADNKESYQKICEKVMLGLQENDNQMMMVRFRGIVWKGQDNIDKVNKLVNVILTGARRPYLKAKKETNNDLT